MGNKIQQFFKIKFSVICEITNYCNLNCHFCYLKQKDRLNRNEIRLNQFIKMLDYYRPRFLQITGGEPLIHKEFLPILEYSLRKTPQVSISTNGILLPKFLPIIREFKKKPILSISLDGPRDVHDYIRNRSGLYISIIKSIINAKKYKIPVTLNMTVFGSGHMNDLPYGNLPYVRDIIEISKKFQTPVNIQPYSPCDSQLRNELGKMLLNSNSKYLINSQAYRKILIDGNPGKCHYNWGYISINASGQPMKTEKNDCYFAKKCDNCYYSCVWEPTLITSKYFFLSFFDILRTILLTK
jgi:MoaA/NifB/PqqE/SkfB family radical SAM enzyme